jgi:hypothetical protein
MSAIEHCRTAALGGHVEACEDCGHRRIAYNSCRNRHCPKCQGSAARTWLAEREADLLPVGYFHVVFTLPAEVADIAYQNKAVVYDLLFRGGVGDDADDRRRPEAPRRSDRHHRRAPHLGLGADAPSARPHDRAGRRHRARRSRWISSRPAFLLPVRVLGKLFRACSSPGLIALHDAGRSPSSAAWPSLPTDAPSCAIWRRPEEALGSVYAKPPVRRPGGGARLSLALHSRVAFSNRRLIAFDEAGVTFRYKDYRRDGADRQQVMTLATDEFIRRFLLHVLPRGFHRIRHYGLLAGSTRKASLALARDLLAVAPPADNDTPEDPINTRPPCPCCGGRMIIIEAFARWNQPRAPPRGTTSTGRTAP